MSAPPPGLVEAVQAVQQLGGIFLSREAAVTLAVAALSAARLPMMGEIYADIADDETLPLTPDARHQLDAIGWYLRQQGA